MPQYAHFYSLGLSLFISGKCNMQAIQTRILPCTNNKPTRIKAWAWAGEITLSVHKIPASYDVTMHEYAARELANKFNWLSEPYTSLHSGCLANGDYCHVIVKE